ncbi:hypothetical protein ACHAXS_010250, partial [Conticribra weissflogii]
SATHRPLATLAVHSAVLLSPLHGDNAALAYEESDYASKTVTSVVQCLKDTAGDEQGTFATLHLGGDRGDYLGGEGGRAPQRRIRRRRRHHYIQPRSHPPHPIRKRTPRRLSHPKPPNRPVLQPLVRKQRIRLRLLEAKVGSASHVRTQWVFGHFAVLGRDFVFGGVVRAAECEGGFSFGIWTLCVGSVWSGGFVGGEWTVD